MNIRSLFYFFVTSISKKMVHNRLLVDYFSVYMQPKTRRVEIDSDIVKWLKKSGVKLTLLTLFLVLLVNALWSFINGNFFPDKLPITRTFCEDTADLINYVVICPIYITFCICFIRHIPYLRIKLKKNGVFKSIGYNMEFDRKYMILKILILGLLVIVVSAVVTYFYILDVNKFNFRFWYQKFINNHDKILNAHGYYYILMSFILMAITFAVVAAHFELFSVSSRIGKTIEEKLSDKKWNFGKTILSKEEIVKMFSPFSSLHVISKILVVTYLVNIYTWKTQKPDFTGMLDISIVALAILGTTVVSYPRYHIQYYIFKIWKKHGINEYPEIRNPIQIGLCSLADFLILGGAMTNLLAYVLKKSNLDLIFF